MSFEADVFDIVLDKGTLDAVVCGGQAKIEAYMQNMNFTTISLTIIDVGGLLEWCRARA